MISLVFCKLLCYLSTVVISILHLRLHDRCHEHGAVNELTPRIHRYKNRVEPNTPALVMKITIRATIGDDRWPTPCMGGAR